MTRLAVIALVMSATACSHFMRAVEFGSPAEKKPDCSTSLAAPAADLIGVSIAAALIFSGTLDSEPESDDAGPGMDLGEPLRYLFVGVTGVIYLLSSGDGLLKIRRCHRARRRHRTWLRARGETWSPEPR